MILKPVGLLGTRAVKKDIDAISLVIVNSDYNVACDTVSLVGVNSAAIAGVDGLTVVIIETPET